MYTFKKPPECSSRLPWLRHKLQLRLVAVDAVNGYALIQFVHKSRRTPRVIRLGKFVLQLCCQVARMSMRFVLLLVVAVGAIHIRQHRLAIGCFVKCLCRARAVGMFCCVLFEDFPFLFRALCRTLPISTE